MARNLEHGHEADANSPCGACERLAAYDRTVNIRDRLLADADRIVSAGAGVSFIDDPTRYSILKWMVIDAAEKYHAAMAEAEGN